MEIKIQYTGQLANLTGTPEESVDLKSGTTLAQMISELVSRHGSDYSDLLLNAQGNLRPSLLVIFDGEQAEAPLESLVLDDVHTVMLMTPIAGG
jgi:molybdopterin converting factor small subunit